VRGGERKGEPPPRLPPTGKGAAAISFAFLRDGFKRLSADLGHGDALRFARFAPALRVRIRGLEVDKGQFAHALTIARPL